jgi:tetratricopeptide (TPR) repeat protein
MRGARPPVAQTVNWSEELQKLDRGAYRAAVVKFASDRVDDDPAHRVWRAEVLCYLDRLEEAREELAVEIAPPLEARALLVEAECALWDSATESAERYAHEVLARRTGEGERARAMAMLARAAVRRGEYAEALERIREARPAVEAAGLRHLGAVLWNAEGYARAKTGHDETLGDLFARAIATFRVLGDRRWEAIARSTCGMWLDETGRAVDAEREQTAALRIAGREGFKREATLARHNLIVLYMAAGRMAEAEGRLDEVLVAVRARADGQAEAHGLVSLAFALAMQGQTARARSAADAGALVAESIGARSMLIEARLLAAWLAAREGSAEAIAALERGRAGTGEETAAQRYRATLYLADAVAAAKPDLTTALLAEAARAPEADERSTFAMLAEYVRHRAGARPVKQTADGELVFSTRYGFPVFTEAVANLERYLVNAAMIAADGMQRDAAKLLAMSTSNLNKKIKRHWPERVKARASWPS